MRKFLKLFCLFLTIVIVFNGFNAIAFAEQNVKSNDVVGNPENILLKGDLPLSELKNRQLPNQDKPEVVSFKSINANGHVNRLHEQEESLNDIIFQNRDGSKTLYSFTYPVKYIAKDGTVRDKKTNISTTIDKNEFKNDYLYANIENDIKTYFPKKLSSSSGVLLEVADVKIEMFPVSSKKVTVGKNTASQKANQTASLKSTYKDEEGEEKDTVIYKNVFGKDTSLRYTSQFVGFKEDVILDKYTGVNEFVFKIKTNGLSLISSEDGSLILVDPNNKTMVASLGNLMIYDSSVDGDGSDKYTRAALYEHYYRVTAEKENSEYLVTIHVDDAYLKSEATVYPVYVDPTLTVWHTIVLGDPTTGSFGNYSNYMQTTYIQQGDTANYGTALMKVGAGASVGSGEEDKYPDARSLINFNWLTYKDTRNPLLGRRIASAKLYIRDLFPSISIIKVGLYGVKRSWTVDNANGMALWNEYSNTQYGQSRVLAWNRGVEAIGHDDNQSVGHWYSFDVTDYIRGSLNSESSYGLMLKVSDTLYENAAIHTIAGATYLGNPTLRPALVVEYEDLNFNVSETISLCASVQSVNNTTSKVVGVNHITVATASSAEPAYYKFSTLANTEYYFKSVGQWTSDATIWIYTDDGKFFEFSRTVPQYTFKTKAAKTYYIRIVGNGAATSGRFIITRDYTNDSKRIYRGTMVAYYDKSFMERHQSNQKAQEAITEYFKFIKDKMLQYFNVELTYDEAQYSEYEQSFKSNDEDNNSFNDFYTDACELVDDLNSDDVYTFVFTGKSLIYTYNANLPINHDPKKMDCTYENRNLILITRQNYFDEKGVWVENTPYIKYSAWHELLHNFGAEDQYCPYGKEHFHQYTTCGNKYCFYHVENNNSTDANELGLPYSVYKFTHAQISEICVMYSPKNDNAKESVCGCCMTHVFEKLKGGNITS